MGQYWRLVNIDKRCSLGTFGGKLLEFLSDDELRHLVPLLSIPHYNKFKAPGGAIAAVKGRRTGSRLISLPQELVDAVVEDVSDVADLLALAPTCGYFFRLLAPKAYKALVTDAAPWAGDRLVLVGDYAYGVPDGVATDDELEGWRAKFPTEDPDHQKDLWIDNPLYVLGERAAVAADDEIDGIEGDGGDGDDDGFHEAHRRRNLGKFAYHAAKAWATDCFDLPRGALARNIRRRLAISATVGDVERLESLLVTIDTEHPGALVLRNLTTKEYIRDTVLDEFLYPELEYGYRAMLGHLICVLVRVHYLG